MYLSGIADEAGKPIDTQIRAHTELGWKHIEIRNVDGVNLASPDMPEATFEAIREKVTEAGLQVSCFASELANWARPISGDFQLDVDQLRTAVPRMHKCGTEFIRTMSWPNDMNNPLGDDDWRDEAIRRMRELAKVAEDGGVTLVHENCSGWAGQGPEQSLRLLEEVGSERLKLVFDTGNTLGHGQDPWEYYRGVKDHIVYVHVKDRKMADGKEQACYCGEGDARVCDILTDLYAAGYRGGVSIEPHLAAAVHLGKEAEDEAAYRIYVEYGRKMTQIVEEIRRG
jgi:sugar phosphate isomerase/epimerase